MRNFSLIVVTVALALGPNARGAAPPVAEPAPLFIPDRFHVNPIHLVVHGFGGAQPHALPAVLFAGHHKDVSAWDLEGVLTGREGRAFAGTATAVLSGTTGNPFAVLATLRMGDYLNCWTLRDTDQFYRIPVEWFESVSDGQPILQGKLETENYARILTLANYTSDKALRGQARSDITAAHLMGDPAFYRGQVVAVDGFLRRINRFQPPRESVMEGVNDLYEAWVFPDSMGAKAFCVVFTEWPAGLSRDLLGKGKIDPGIRIKLAGYFFKLFAYEAADRINPNKIAPLLVAHTLTLQGPRARPEAEASAAWVKPIIYAVPALFVALLFAVVGLTYYFRRQDGQLRARLRLARDAEFVPPPPDALPVVAPVVAVHPVRAPVQGFRLRPPPHGAGGSDSDSGPPESGGKPPDDVTGV